MKQVPIKDIPEEIIAETEQIGRSLESILPDGSEYIVVAVVPGADSPSHKSNKSRRFLTSMTCYGEVSYILLDTIEDLMGRKCPHELEEDDEDPCLKISRDYRPN